MEEAIKKIKEILTKDGIIKIITHLDTDGLTSATILSQILKKYNQHFWVTVVKQLEDELIEKWLKEVEKQKWKALFFLDLGASKLSNIKEFAKYTNVFVIDHHELESNFSLGNVALTESLNNFFFIGQHFYGNEKMSAACLTYLFIKELELQEKNNENEDFKKLAQLAILGMIGDVLDKNIGKNVKCIIKDAEESGMQIKKGLTVFSAMRPIHKSLEFSSNIFIPGVTGSANGALMMLRDLGIEVKTSRGYKTLLDLNKDELSKLITAILLKRVSNGHSQDILDNIYLIKIGNRLFDAREVSSMLNACGRLGYSTLALAFLIGSKKAQEKIEEVYAKYKHYIIKALNWVNARNCIKGDNYVLINAKNAIKDTIIGTIVSILASSFLYEDGTIIVGAAYRKDNKIKVSARVVKGSKNNDINLYNLLNSVVKIVGGEVGGHSNAAGCLISKDKEKEFFEILEKKLSAQEIKIKC